MTLVRQPEDRKWLQPNTSVLFGNIYETKNMDFSLPGFVKVAPRTRYVGREDAASSSFENVTSIVYGAFGGTASGFSSTNLYYFLTNDTMYVATPDLADFGALTNATPPTMNIYGDMLAHGNNLFVTNSQEINFLSGGTWLINQIAGQGGTIMTADTPHPIGTNVLFSTSADILYGNGNQINATTTAAGSYTTGVIVLNSNLQVQWIRTFNSAVWFGTRNLRLGNARVYQWDGTSTNWNYEYEVDCQWVYSGCEWQGNFYIITNDGRLMAFNGSGFTEVARLPCYTNIITTNNYFFGNAFTLGSIAQRGMAVIDGLIHVMVNAEATNDGGTVEEATTRLMSGIWVYDPQVGFYNKYTPSNSTSTTNTDFGQMALEDGAGAIAPLVQDPTAASPVTSSVGGTLLYGAKLNGGTSTNYYTAGSVTSGENRGYMTTARLESDEIQDSWRDVWVKFEEMQNATDAIVLRYRTEDREGLPFTTSSDVTWTSTTVFTSTDTRFANVVAGDEVTVITGDGAGSTVNISTITENTGTYTVTVDEAVTAITASDVGKVAISNFQRMSPTISEATIDNVQVFARHAKIVFPFDTEDSQSAPSEWVEVKMEVRGENVRISQFIVLSETQQFVII